MSQRAAHLKEEQQVFHGFVVRACQKSHTDTHLRLISLAAVIGAALPVAIWAKSRKSHLLSGAPLAGLLPVVM